MNCPLCHSSSLQTTQKIDKNDLIKLWASSNLDVTRLLPSDLLLNKCHICGLQFYSPLSPGDDFFYGDLAEWSWYYKHPGKSEYSYASKLLSQGDSVIDIGCGIGEFSTFIPNDCTFTGIELSSRSVEIAQSLRRNVRRISVEDAAKSYGQSFDYVVCFQVLEHLTLLDTFLMSCVDLCKKGGFLIFAVPNNDSFVGNAINNMLNLPPHHTLLWNKQSLLYLAKKFNLKVLDYVEEPLQSVHKQWAYTTYVNSVIRKCFGFDDEKISLSLSTKMVYRLSSLVARLISLVFPSLIKKGHSSIILLQKV